MNSDLILGIDIGGTKVAVAVAHPSGVIVAGLSVSTDLCDHSATLSCILNAMQAVMNLSPRLRSRGC